MLISLLEFGTEGKPQRDKPFPLFVLWWGWGFLALETRVMKRARAESLMSRKPFRPDTNSNRTLNTLATDMSRQFLRLNRFGAQR